MPDLWANWESDKSDLKMTHSTDLLKRFNSTQKNDLFTYHSFGFNLFNESVNLKSVLKFWTQWLNDSVAAELMNNSPQGKKQS